MAWFPGARATPWPALGLWAAAYAAYLTAAGSAGAFSAAGPAAGDGRLPSAARIWSAGIGVRLALLPAAPHFSDDLWRYLWDGHVQVHGVNPYLHPPASESLSGLRTAWHGLVNHPEVSTIYPPGAQAVFALLALAAASPLVYKAAWIVADLAVAWCVGRAGAARSGGDGRLPLLLYLWCPLPLVEVAWSGHLDPLGVFLMLGAVLAAEAGVAGDRRGLRAVGAGGLLGAAASVKFAPAAALPALWRRRGGRAAAAFAVVVVLVAAPYLGAGARMLDGLAVYASRWSFHPGPHALLAAALGSAAAAKWASAGAVAALAGWAAWRRWTLARTLFWVIGAGLLLSPTLHPWYLLWLLPFAALRRSPGWLLLAGTAFLGYWNLDLYRATGEWSQPAWLSALMWGPPLAVMAWSALRRRGADPRETG